MQVFLNKEKLGQFTKTGNTTVQLSSSVITIGAKQYSSPNLTLDISSSGVGGLDTGTVSANTLYYVYTVVSSGNVALTASLGVNSIGPIGYDNWKLIGALITDHNSQIGSPVNIEGKPCSEDFVGGAVTIDGTTSAPTKGTTVYVDEMIWKLNGEFFEGTYNYRQLSTGGAAGNGTYLFSMPSGLLLDTSKRSVTTIVTVDQEAQIVGVGSVSSGAGGTMGTVVAHMYDANRFWLSISAAGTDAGGGSSAIGDSIGSTAFDLTSSNVYKIMLKIPIQGWSNTPLKDL